MMDKRWRAPVTAALMLWAGLHGAQAALVSADDPVLGTGAITYDPSTDLEWLDVDRTIGCDLATLAGSGVCGGVDLAGWRLASLDQVRALWAQGGLTAPQNASAYTATNAAAITALLALTGLTYDNTSFFGAHAFYDAGNGEAWMTQLVVRKSDGLARDRLVAADLFAEGWPTVGAWMYRLRLQLPPVGTPAQVPEPATVLLLAGALALALGRRRPGAGAAA